MTTIAERLRAAKDVVGWRPPYHYHYRIETSGGPPRAVFARPSECEAPGCPRTESGFPGERRVVYRNETDRTITVDIFGRATNVGPGETVTVGPPTWSDA